MELITLKAPPGQNRLPPPPYYPRPKQPHFPCRYRNEKPSSLRTTFTSNPHRRADPCQHTQQKKKRKSFDAPTWPIPQLTHEIGACHVISSRKSSLGSPRWDSNSISSQNDGPFIDLVSITGGVNSGVANSLK